MTTERKIFLSIGLATLAIIVGGIFLLNRNPSSPSGKRVDEKLLVRDDSQKIFSATGSATLVEFSDYQCPACGAYHPVIKELLSDFQGKLNFVYRNFPLPQHKNAPTAAYAAEAAGNQGKFWEMHDMLFENQSKWSNLDNPTDTFVQYAQTLKLDVNKFSQDLNSDKIRQKIDRDVADGTTTGIDATPTFFLNGEKLVNPRSLDDFKTLVSAAIANSSLNQSGGQKYHIHADFKVYINGVAIDFSVAKYQSTEKKELDPDIHLHDRNGKVIHIHKKGATLGEFFKSLGMSLSSTCFKLDTGQEYCNEGGKTLKMFVNGKQNSNFDNYEPQDLDRIMISYGESQINSVSADACIYSLKCPERGTPPPESCAGGLGTSCD